MKPFCTGYKPREHRSASSRDYPRDSTRLARMSIIRKAVLSDLGELLRLESAAFSSDRLSRRSFRRWLKHAGCVFLVSEDGDALSGYILIILRRGTRLARLYSLAVDPASRGRGIASSLIARGEEDARDEGALYLRLEVAGNNTAAIALYQKLGYSQFGLYRDYYEDHSDALRLEKRIHRLAPDSEHRVIPWIPQTTPFTCGTRIIDDGHERAGSHIFPQPPGRGRDLARGNHHFYDLGPWRLPPCGIGAGRPHPWLYRRGLD